MRIVIRIKSPTPDDLATLCDQTELTDVDLDDRSLGDDPECGVERRGGILLYPQDGQVKCGLQLGVSYMCFLKP